MVYPVHNNLALPAPSFAIEIQPANPLDRDFEILRKACFEKHIALVNPIRKILVVATIIIAIVAAFLVSGVKGLLLGLAIYFLGGYALCKAYYTFVNRDYLDVHYALKQEAFRDYIVTNNLPRSVNHMLQNYAQYKAYVVAQTEHLLELD